MSLIEPQPKSTYKNVGLVLGNEITGELTVQQISWMAFDNTPGVPVVFNGVMAQSVSSRLSYMQMRVREAEARFSRRFDARGGEDLIHLAFTVEDVVMHMKRVIDDFFTNEWIRLEGGSAEFVESRTVRVLGVNEVDSKCPPGATKVALQALKNKHESFFQVLIDLRNSFAHHPLVALSYDQVGIDHITINTVVTKNGDLNTLTETTVLLEDLLRSFNRFMIETFLMPR